MVGSPKKRARRIAQAKANGEIPPLGPASYPQKKSPPPPPPKPEGIEEDLVVQVIEARERHAEVDGWIEDAQVPSEIVSQRDKIFNELLDLSFDRALDIMRIKPGDDNFNSQVLTRQASIIASVLSTTAKIDEARLRGRGKDKVNEILLAIKAEEKKAN